MYLHHTHTQYKHNLNMAPSSKPPLCDVIYVYYKVALPEVENQKEVERLVCAYVLFNNNKRSMMKYMRA